MTTPSLGLLPSGGHHSAINMPGRCLQSPLVCACTHTKLRLCLSWLPAYTSAAHVQARLLVASSQIGCILGKGGSIVSDMRKTTGARIKILSPKERPPICAEGDELIHITGDQARVRAALEAITAQLRANPPKTQPQVRKKKMQVSLAIDHQDVLTVVVTPLMPAAGGAFSPSHQVLGNPLLIMKQAMIQGACGGARLQSAAQHANGHNCYLW